ncbi:uncharacterized protein KQ657_001098 [Scheffersomyces spartinae]|uniref:Uncharacterized protein n=1 Tax=Scheffersomyces spartinae TaxID=45513 RepID=A0A9P8AHX9_9ASCO|nr:uncharacterized protein KQ657_001098 [Scheffersomyces spartinae]KAG7192988.1 hypothetical protein KQ657_001098 [Scheffersomyces spartinae]
MFFHRLRHAAKNRFYKSRIAAKLHLVAKPVSQDSSVTSNETNADVFSTQPITTSSTSAGISDDSGRKQIKTTCPATPFVNPYGVVSATANKTHVKVDTNAILDSTSHELITATNSPTTRPIIAGKLFRSYAQYYEPPPPVVVEASPIVFTPMVDEPSIPRLDLNALPFPNLSNSNKLDNLGANLGAASVLTWGTTKRTIPTDIDDISSIQTFSTTSSSPVDNPEVTDGEAVKCTDCDAIVDSKVGTEVNEVIEPPPKRATTALATSTLKRNDNYYLQADDGMEKVEDLIESCLSIMNSISCYSEFEQHLKSNPDLEVYYFEDFEQLTRILSKSAAAPKVVKTSTTIQEWYRTYMDLYLANGGYEDPKWKMERKQRLPIRRFNYMDELEAQRKIEEANYVDESVVEALVEELYQRIPDAFDLMLKIPNAYTLDVWLDRGVKGIPNVPRSLFNEIETYNTELNDLYKNRRIKLDQRYSATTALTDSQKILDWFKSIEEVQYYATFFGLTVIV